MPETTENYHRIPVSSGHSGHEIKTIVVSEKDGIKALYCTDCKEIVTYLFDTDKWTMTEAQEWVDSHKSRDGDIMGKRLDMRAKDMISSSVRFKSYGTFLPKGAGEGDGSEMLVRGFFTSDEMDEVGDIITKKATVDAVERWRKWGNIRTMHLNPSGRIEKIGEADGLAWNEVVTVPVEKTTRELIEGGVLKAYSVGIIPREYELNEEALEAAGEEADPWFFPLIIHSYDMVEISYVDHPANYAATIQEIGSKEFSKNMSHRNVIFKNSEIMGDIEDMEEELDGINDGDVTEETSVDEPLPESDVEQAEEGEGAEEAVDVVAGDENSDEQEEEDVVERSEEEEFDVALAVSEMKDTLGGIEARVSNLAESLDGIVDRVVERFMDAMTANQQPQEEPVLSEDASEDEAVKSFNEEEFVDKVVDKVLSGLVDILVPTAVRSARVAVDEPDDGEEAEDSASKTKRYMEMTPQDRRKRMKEVLAETITKNK